MRRFEQDRKAALAGKYNYLNPKKSFTVPSEYIKQVLMRGTGFIGGKGRVYKIFETEIDAGTRAKRIKAEYGQGGAGWPVDGLGLHGYDTFHGNGLRFQWRDEDGEVIDAEYREVEPEEAESELDDYAIPDEPESYASSRDYVSAKGMTPQEAADEDRMITQAEYGAEIEAETSEKDPSELQYITPIDYAKRIAELDEDLRDAAEILVTDCSCYTPFRAFLMDDKASQQTVYNINKNDSDQARINAEDAKLCLKKYKLENYSIYVKAIDDYEHFLVAGKNGNGGILKDRERSERALRKATDDLKGAQYTYNAARTVENQIAVEEGSQAQYRSRKDRIWMDDRQEIQEKLKSQTQKYESIFKNEFVLTVLKSCEAARDDLKHINAELKMLDFKSVYSFDVNYIKDGSDYEKILEYAKYLKEREELGTADGQMTFESMTMYSDDRGEELEKEIKRIISKIVSSNDKEQIEHFADYRNYMNYEILVSNDDVLNKAKLSKQSGYNSGAEVQIPYMLILLSALLMIYNDKTNSTRLVFIDELFAKMDPTNIRTMLKFMKNQKLQMIFCAPDKTELIGNECQVILPVLRTKPDLMEIGIVEIHEGASA